MCKNKAFNISKDKFLIASLAIVLSLYLSGSFVFFYVSAGSVRNNVVRLHVIANSDSLKDQEVKLKVRDALLKKNNAMLSGEVNKDNALQYFKSSQNEVLKTLQSQISGWIKSCGGHENLRKGEMVVKVTTMKKLLENKWELVYDMSSDEPSSSTTL